MGNGKWMRTRTREYMDVFIVRMLTYFFGDWEKRGKHQWFNSYKTLGQQYYMALDSNNLQNMHLRGGVFSQHAVLTSNQRFHFNQMTMRDFLFGNFRQDDNGNYYLNETSGVDLEHLKCSTQRQFERYEGRKMKY